MCFIISIKSQTMWGFTDTSFDVIFLWFILKTINHLSSPYPMKYFSSYDVDLQSTPSICSFSSLLSHILEPTAAPPVKKVWPLLHKAAVQR